MIAAVADDPPNDVQLRQHFGRLLTGAVAGLLALLSAGCSESPTPTAPSPVTTVTTLRTTLAPTTTIKLPVAVSQCPRHAVSSPGGLIEAPGSALSLDAGAGVPATTLDNLAQYLCMARVDQGDSGPLNVHILANVDEFVTAYSAAVPGQGDHIRSLIAQGLRAETRTDNIWFTPNVIAGPGPTLAETVFHEYFHTVQRYLIGRDSYTVPPWLLEGTGLFFGFSRAQALGLDNFDKFRADELVTAKRSTQPLSAYEQLTGVGTPQAYAM
ncbi:MAG: hypothetical protein M3256_26365, partial [Actinomycetota bacterium]|nr:hypothetical protein [Actinomycetota bacterium]